jgi:hypothetical protein
VAAGNGKDGFVDAHFPWDELTATTLGRYVGLSFGITDTLLLSRGVAHRTLVSPQHLAPGAAHVTNG